MKRFLPALVLLFVFATACFTSGCATTKIDTPNTPSNTGGAALVAYIAAGTYASEYFSLPLCTTPITAPCKVQSVNDRLNDVDQKAHDAAKAADAALNDAAKQTAAAAALKVLNDTNATPAVSDQVNAAKAAKASGGTP